jgi:hypothetical protein
MSKMHAPQRFHLITYPRMGFNLLVRMLGLNNQPQVPTGVDRGGYIFLPAVKFMTDLGLREKNGSDAKESISGLL